MGGAGKRLTGIFLLLLIMVWPHQSLAETSVSMDEALPLYEYGVVAVAASLPHYRGSDESQGYLFPLPYFAYRGERLKASRDGLRGIFWRNKRFETDLSLSGNPPVSSDNDAREGMPELDALIEMGPALRFYFLEYGERDSFFLQTNLRAAVSLGFDDGLDMEYQGYTSELSLVYRNSQLLKEENLRFHLNTGFQFSDTELHSYFYEVKDEYGTSKREPFKVKGGYTGFQLSGSLLKEFTPKLWFSLYGRWLNNSGVAYRNSPLVQVDNNYIIGTMVIWKFGESEKRERRLQR